jgi:hypothetical protein
VLSVETIKALRRIHVRNRMVIGFSSTKLMGMDEDSHDSHPHSCSVRLSVANRWEYSPLSGYNTESLTVDHSG